MPRRPCGIGSLTETSRTGRNVGLECAPMFRRSSTFLSALLFCAASALAACGGGGAAGSSGGDTTPKPVLTGGDPTNGEKLYNELGCKGCHGAPGEKGDVGPNLFAITWDDHEREEAREIILEGDLDHK